MPSTLIDKLYYVLICHENNRIKITAINEVDMSNIHEYHINKINEYGYSTFIGVNPYTYTIIGDYNLCAAFIQCFMFASANELSPDPEQYMKDVILLMYDQTIDACDKKKEDPVPVYLKTKNNEG